MPKFCLTFKEELTQSAVYDSIYRACEYCWNPLTAPIAVNKLLHSMAYLTFFQVSNYRFDDGAQYSIEDICSLLGGLIGHDAMHEFLTRIGNYDKDEKHQEQVLREIITDGLLYEVLTFLVVDANIVMGALCAAWCIISHHRVLLEDLDNIRNLTTGNHYEKYFAYISDVTRRR